MPKLFLSLLSLLALAVLARVAIAEPLAGYDRFTVPAPHRAGLVAASLWYPAGTPTYRGLVGDNPVFQGTEAMIGAGIAPGRHPLVLLSHGSGGNMDGLGWLSSRLAARGAIVLAVNHPGSTSGDSSPRRSLEFGDRARDLSRALDTLLANPAFSPFIDPSRITALGFSLGGVTALNLAGARFDPALYRDYCARNADQGDCVFFAKGGVDFAHLPEDFAADARDPRVTSLVAIDPGATHALTTASLAAMTLPTLFVNLGGAERWKSIDVSAAGSDLVHRLPQARYVVVEPAIHFTMLGLCKPEAHDLLLAEHDDPVCDDPAGADRAKAHAKIAEAVLAFLGL
ncbi:dienelactone hydrolase [Aureimonas endophytica]|uniref:Dienelactone hydrolase n=1 Tax=Aureimonas endophytica TaxID=2027858 RepID=A0A916ZNR6_9HYPH|nr:hypothetical protein [Aureimonas endophytica]GGE06752.1 dienelactone hydrolase [Aureimonas endophytica]